MTDADARVVARILVTADHDCPVCARELLYTFVRAFPAFRDVATQAYVEAFDDGELFDAPGVAVLRGHG